MGHLQRRLRRLEAAVSAAEDTVDAAVVEEIHREALDRLDDETLETIYDLTFDENGLERPELGETFTEDELRALPGVTERDLAAIDILEATTEEVFKEYGYE